MLAFRPLTSNRTGEKYAPSLNGFSFGQTTYTPPTRRPDPRRRLPQEQGAPAHVPGGEIVQGIGKIDLLRKRRGREQRGADRGAAVLQRRQSVGYRRWRQHRLGHDADIEATLSAPVPVTVSLRRSPGKSCAGWSFSAAPLSVSRRLAMAIA
jgi:hypothetical protein